MSRADKLLERMRRNPAGNWNIEDIQRVCSRIDGLECEPPAHGSHFKVSHPKARDILTVPANRPIKPVYVKRLVSMIDDIMEVDDAATSGDPSVAA